MSLSYFNIKKLGKQPKQTVVEPNTAPLAPTVNTPSEEPAASPVLDEEDEKFLQRLAAIAQEPEGTPPPLPTRPAEVIQDAGEKKVGKDAQEAIMGGADKVPLPMSPPEISGEEESKEKGKGKDDGLNRRKSVMSYFSLAQARFKKATEKDKSKEKEKDAITAKDKQKAADALHLAAESAKSAEQKEMDKENQDLTAILDQLNLAAVNNRVFSFSAESEELFAKFKLVLKDIVNGAPTAYNDLEKLFTDYEATLKKMYGNLPPFLQNLVKSLPAKITATLGPELMAAQAEKPGFDAKRKAATGAAKKSAKARIPSLKSLLSAEGAVATMLRSILNFLKLRFPAIMTGTNVVMSLAVCLLLFVFWYCHKRGRETRLEKERLTTGEGDSALASDASYDDDGDSVFGSKNIGSAGKDNDGAEEEGKADPPLIISDGNEGGLDKPRASVNDMPSVKNLPSPAAAPSTPKE